MARITQSQRFDRRKERFVEIRKVLPRVVTDPFRPLPGLGSQAPRIWNQSARVREALQLQQLGGECVGVARNIPGTVALRDSKDPKGRVLRLSPAAWACFASAQ
ncbi:DUF397 domain-containing protein [Streptomyces caeni]|uniref:DUF397 domain-containing protein n=1 Tax=Streptomyces caeni TaxID=2307231 RepID=A0ABW4IX86_9ACTN